MKEWTGRLVILGLLAVVLGVPFLLRPSDASTNDAAGPETAGGKTQRLVILSPHNEQIRFEFARAFNASRQKRGQPPVKFDWRSSGGTSELRRGLDDQFTRLAKSHREDDGIGADLFFGGGDIEHNGIARGIEVERDGAKIRIPLSIPAEIPESLMKEAFPLDNIAGVPLYHEKRRWMGVVLSSFGIVYNRDVHTMLKLPEPQTWEQLADPRYRGWVALSDPEYSGSVAATYNTVVRRLGWDDGWMKLRRIFANARYVTTSGQRVPVDVSAGEAAAGMCIDFYGRYQAGAIGADRVGYIDPVGMTAVTPDTISILRGAPSRELANEFVVWLLSIEAQRLWNRRVGEPDGPVRFELRRMPIRRDMFTSDEMAHWTDKAYPFDIAKPFPQAMPDYFRPVRAVLSSMAISVNDELKAAWKAISDNPSHPRMAEMLAAFDAMPEELTMRWPDEELKAQWKAAIEDPSHPRHKEAAGALKAFSDGLAARYSNYTDRDKLLADRIAWTEFFRAKYREVVAIENSR